MNLSLVQCYSKFTFTIFFTKRQKICFYSEIYKPLTIYEFQFFAWFNFDPCITSRKRYWLVFGSFKNYSSSSSKLRSTHCPSSVFREWRKWILATFTQIRMSIFQFKIRYNLVLLLFFFHIFCIFENYSSNSSSLQPTLPQF